MVSVPIRVDGSKADGYSANGDGLLCYAPDFDHVLRLVVACLDQTDPGFGGFYLILSDRLRKELGAA